MFSLARLIGYIFWRLTWIHPFEDGNGRTAHYFCYLIGVCFRKQAPLLNKKVFSKFCQKYLEYRRAETRKHIILMIREIDSIWNMNENNIKFNLNDNEKQNTHFNMYDISM